MTPPIYLDYNSTTPIDERVLETMLPYFTKHFGNASSKTHAFGWEADAAVERAREEVAAFINATPEEIIFTSGSTEAINIAIRGVAASYGVKGNHIISASTEHKAVLDTLASLEKTGFKVTYLNPDKEGLIDAKSVEEAITDKTILVCIMTANNETGVIQPVSDFGKICHERKVIFFTDATQCGGRMPVDVNDMHCDLLSLSAHKMYGPKGSGALYIRRKNPSVKLLPAYTGGGHEKNLRPGTLNVPGIVGLGKACTLTANLMKEDSARLSTLRNLLEQKLREDDAFSVNGSVKNRLCNTSNISFHGIQASGLIAALPGLAFSTGSACTSALPEPSHVLKAMGFSDEHVYSSIRLSLGRFTTEEEVLRAADLIQNAVRKLKG